MYTMTFVCAAELSENVTLTSTFDVEFDNKTTSEEWEELYWEMAEITAAEFSKGGHHFEPEDIEIYSEEDWETLFEVA